MENGELPKSPYNMSLVLYEAGKNNWVSHVRNLLFRYGFGFAFDYQEVGDQKRFLCLFKQRPKDNYVEEWASSTNETSRLKFYCKCKNIFEMKKCLSVVCIRKYRIVLSKFHCTNHELSVEIGRKQNVPYNLRLCVFCLKRGLHYIDDELYVLLIYPLYEELKTRYLPQARSGNISTFINILSTKLVVTVAGKRGSNYRLSLSCNRKSKKLNLANLFNSQQ